MEKCAKTSKSVLKNEKLCQKLKEYKRVCQKYHSTKRLFAVIFFWGTVQFFWDEPQFFGMQYKLLLQINFRNVLMGFGICCTLYNVNPC